MPQIRSGVNRLRACSTGCIAATKLIWTAVILNGSEASGPLANGRALKCIARQCIKPFVAKRVFCIECCMSEVQGMETENPPPMGLN